MIHSEVSVSHQELLSNDNPEMMGKLQQKHCQHDPHTDLWVEPDHSKRDIIESTHEDLTFYSTQKLPSKEW